MWVPCLEGTTSSQGHMVYHPLNIFLFMRYPPYRGACGRDFFCSYPRADVATFSIKHLGISFVLSTFAAEFEKLSNNPSWTTITRRI